MNHSYRKFVNIFSETFNSSFPVRPGSPPKKRKHKPWMTKGLVNACKKKNLLYKCFLTSRSSMSEIRYSLVVLGPNDGLLGKNCYQAKCGIKRSARMCSLTW